MATVTVVNAERTLEIEATSIVSGLVNAAGHLILTRHDGTDLDMGAVSGMQLDGGTTYSKVDAFTYVGDTDPGAVPDGSVWLDTNDVAGPFASDTQKGLVELATTTETDALTDGSRAVTPAGIAPKINFITGRLDTLEATRTRILTANSITEVATPTAYPTGVSMMTLTSGSGWSLAGGFGAVVTNKIENDRTTQFFYPSVGGTNTAQTWMRIHHSSTGGGGWTAWTRVMTLATLTPGSFVQTTAFTSYPSGWSRLYYTTANSTGWDFTGSAGEVLTYVDGTDFAKQTWTLHVGGSGTPEMWLRTANTTGGWTAWRKILTDPGGWTSWTPTWSTSSGANAPSLGNAVVECKYTKRGRTVDCRFEITFGSTTNFGAAPTTGDNWQFSLPVAAADSGHSIGFLELRQTNDLCGMGRAKLHSTTGFRISMCSGLTNGAAIANTGDVDSISPFAWGNTGSVKGHFTYEAAA